MKFKYLMPFVSQLFRSTEEKDKIIEELDCEKLNKDILRAAEIWTFSKAVKALSGLNRRIL